MPNQDLLAYLAVFGGIALFTVVLTVLAVRMRRAADAEGLALRAAQVAEQCKDLLVGPDFLWSVWQKTTKVEKTGLLIRDAHDNVLCTITVPVVPLDGVLRHFELEGRRYEIRKVDLMSNRTCLREAGRDTVLLSADHYTLRIEFFKGDGERQMFVLPAASALKRYRSVMVGEQEIGKRIAGLEQDTSIGIITLPRGRHTILEQVFVLASF